MVIFNILVDDICSDQSCQDAHADLGLHYQQMSIGILQHIGAHMFF